jgi:integrase/rubredoxin
MASHIPLDPRSNACPECGSTKLYRDGQRYLGDGSSVQRWLCRECGYRFSESNGKPFKQNKYLFKNAEQDGCEGPIASRAKSAVMAATALTEPITTMAMAMGDAQQDVKGRMVKFLWQLAKDGTKPNTAKMYEYILLNLVSHGALLDDPETVKEAIARQNWNDKTKALGVSAYSKYLDVMGGTWKKPKYKPERKLPFLPTEEELNCLINAAHKRLATYLSILKATGMRATEAWLLKYEDVDVENNVITLNDTLKHGTPRQFRVKPQVIAMINTLPKKGEYIFHDLEKPCGLINFAKAFRNFRKRLAYKMQNPRLNKISFHSFRHWFATNEYHNTKDIIHVKERLGHKSINTTLLYTQLINFESEQCYSAVAKTKEEAQKLIEQGFRFECNIEDVKLFRKPK